MLIKINNLKKDYHLGKTIVHALRGVDLQVENGEFLSVAGPSGSGKTTLLNLIGCIDKPTEGSIHFEGEEVTDIKDVDATLLRRHKIGFVFQTFNLVPVLTAYENVELPLLLRDSKRDKHQERIMNLLGKVGIAEYARHRPEELSGGQRQRVSIARALVTEPTLVLADEPTANIDQETGLKIIDIMLEMNKELGTTFVFSTHDPKVMAEASRKVELVDGRI